MNIDLIKGFLSEVRENEITLVLKKDDEFRRLFLVDNFNIDKNVVTIVDDERKEIRIGLKDSATTLKNNSLVIASANKKVELEIL